MPMPRNDALDPDATASSHARLLAAAKMLIARSGYEGTSTASLAREAGTSESQLVRSFGSKAGLLEALFETGWRELNVDVQRAAAGAASGRDALLEILTVIIDTFRDDPEMAAIFLFEGRRIRGADHEIFVSEGFEQFHELLLKLVRRAHVDGSFSRPLDEPALASALLGAAEGMVRERVIATRRGDDEPFPRDAILGVFEALLDGL